MDLHDEIMNINVEKRKQNMAIDEAMKQFKNMKDILCAVYARGHRDARHAAAEKTAARQAVSAHSPNCALVQSLVADCNCHLTVTDAAQQPQKEQGA